MTREPASPTLIPVICDRCGAQGLAGKADFAAFDDLLAFEPVPLQVDRVDGFKPEVQRAFIAALTVLGSADRAAKAIGKSATGAERLRNLPGAEGFNRAWERAKAIAQEKGTLRLADSLRGIVATPSAAPLPAPEPAADGELTADERANLDMLAGIVSMLDFKLQAEREARMEGRIAAADFYLRQITWLEVALDLASGDGLRAWRELRHNGEHPIAIAETDMSHLLDFFRRAHWEACGDPPRPEHPLTTLLRQHRGYATEPLEGIQGGPPEDRAAQQRAYDERHAEDAKAQIEWEARARLFWEKSEHGPEARRD